MNLVLDEAEEVNIKKKTRKVLGALFALRPDATRCPTPRPTAAPRRHTRSDPRGVSGGASNGWSVSCCAGRILLKGENITLMQGVKQ